MFNWYELLDLFPSKRKVENIITIHIYLRLRKKYSQLEIKYISYIKYKILVNIKISKQNYKSKQNAKYSKLFYSSTNKMLNIEKIKYDQIHQMIHI